MVMADGTEIVAHRSGVEKAIAGLILLACAFYCFHALNLNFGSLSNPRSGFLPSVIGVAGTVLAAVNLVLTLRKHRTADAEEGALDRYTALNLLLALAGTIAFLILLDVAGYFVASALYLLFLTKLTRSPGWLVPVAVSLGATGFFYFCFVTLLGVTLP